MEFLLDYIERAYGAKCYFDNLLLYMADAAFNNSRKKHLVSGAHIFSFCDIGFVVKSEPDKDSLI